MDALSKFKKATEKGFKDATGIQGIRNSFKNLTESEPEDEERRRKARQAALEKLRSENT